MTRTVSKIGRHLVVLFITKRDANADFYRTTHSFEVFVNLVAFIIADNIVMTWGRICKRKKSVEEEERNFRIEAIFFSSKWGGGGYLPCYFWRAGFPPILPITYQKPDGKMSEWPTKTDFQVPELSF